jgi:hypothetical protein
VVVGCGYAAAMLCATRRLVAVFALALVSPSAAVLRSAPPPRPPGPSGQGVLFGVGAIATHSACEDCML